MSDEENKAIELLKKLQKKTPYIIWGDGTPYNKSNQIQTVLNLIEKQQKVVRKMCEYCVEDKRKKRKFIINSPILSERIINNNDLYAFEILSINRENKIVNSYQTINFCPMCRKRVERT